MLGGVLAPTILIDALVDDLRPCPINGWVAVIEWIDASICRVIAHQTVTVWTKLHGHLTTH